MKLIIKSKGFKISSTNHSFLEKKFEKFNNLLPENQLVRINLESQSIYVMLYLGDTLIEAKTSDKDLYTAIDLVVDKITKQLAHRNNRNKKSVRFSPPKAPSLISQSTTIVKRKSFPMKPMSQEEAILQMNLLKHDFFMFFDDEIQTMCLLYRRKDGNLGLIENEIGA